MAGGVYSQARNDLQRGVHRAREPQRPCAERPVDQGDPSTPTTTRRVETFAELSGTDMSHPDSAYRAR